MIIGGTNHPFWRKTLRLSFYFEVEMQAVIYADRAANLSRVVGCPSGINESCRKGRKTTCH